MISWSAPNPPQPPPAVMSNTKSCAYNNKNSISSIIKNWTYGFSTVKSMNGSNRKWNSISQEENNRILRNAIDKFKMFKGSFINRDDSSIMLLRSSLMLLSSCRGWRKIAIAQGICIRIKRSYIKYRNIANEVERRRRSSSRKRGPCLTLAGTYSGESQYANERGNISRHCTHQAGQSW